MIFLLIVAYIIFISFEVPSLIENKYWKELAVFSFIVFLAFFVSVMGILRIQIPTPAKDVQYGVQYLFKTFLHLSYD